MDITLLIKAVLLLLSFIYTAILVPYIRSKTTETERAKLHNAVVMGDKAAELMFDIGADTYAVVVRKLADQGYKLNAEEVKVLIESAVLELKKGL